MRITGGDFRGRILKAPEGQSTRPTTDRVREALFNVLAHRDWGGDTGFALEGARILDAFAGTGALGIEALSRGAAFASFFEKDRSALRALKDNIAHLKLEKSALAASHDATKPPAAPEPCSLVFLDPPYRKGLIPAALQALGEKGWIAQGAMIVAETAKNETPEMPENCEKLLEKIYGDTKISFYRS